MFLKRAFYVWLVCSFPPHLAADLPLNHLQRSPTPVSNSNLANPVYLPYPNINPYLLQNLANYQAGLGGLAGMGQSPMNQHLQNFLLPQATPSLYGQLAKQSPGSAPMNVPCYDQVQQFLPGVPAANNWIGAGGAFANVLPPNHPYLQVCFLPDP
jgi:hypothetical protein